MSQVFFSSSEIKLVLILFGIKICIGNIFLQNENCNVIIFPLYVFFMYVAEYKHLRHDYVIKKSDLFSIKSHKHCPHLEAFDFERCHHLKYFWHVPFLSFRQWTPPDH